MCGRYTQTASLAELQSRFGFRPAQLELKPRYNIAPTQDAPVVIEEDGRRLELLRWGLIPSWAKDRSIGHRMINARAETLAEKPAFKGLFKDRRCLVLADSFYEWRHPSGSHQKVPVRVVLESGEPFALAGLWDVWKDKDGRLVRSFTIITTDANAAVQPLHDRMPVILRREDEGRWLNPKADAQALTSMLQPWAGGLKLYEVSREVNSPKNDSPECIRAV